MCVVCSVYALHYTLRCPRHYYYHFQSSIFHVPQHHLFWFPFFSTTHASFWLVHRSFYSTIRLGFSLLLILSPVRAPLHTLSNIVLYTPLRRLRVPPKMTDSKADLCSLSLLRFWMHCTNWLLDLNRMPNVDEHTAMTTWRWSLKNSNKKILSLSFI